MLGVRIPPGLPVILPLFDCSAQGAEKGYVGGYVGKVENGAGRSAPVLRRRQDGVEKGYLAQPEGSLWDYDGGHRQCVLLWFLSLSRGFRAEKRSGTGLSAISLDRSRFKARIAFIITRRDVIDTAPDDTTAETPGVGKKWYIIHTYSGFENKVKESLLSRAQAFGLDERIGELLIPTEDVVEMKSGKKVTSKRLLYPGYVLVQLKMDDELWHVVRNTPRVTSFVGSGQVPTPLADDEVNQILYRQTVSKEKPRPKMTFDHNDRVKIIDGPFSNFTGTVEEVNEDRSTIKVMVTIFGRGTPVELEYFQVEKEKV